MSDDITVKRLNLSELQKLIRTVREGSVENYPHWPPGGYESLSPHTKNVLNLLDQIDIVLRDDCDRQDRYEEFLTEVDEMKEAMVNAQDILSVVDDDAEHHISHHNADLDKYYRHAMLAIEKAQKFLSILDPK